jgi:hypothetical protein
MKFKLLGTQLTNKQHIYKHVINVIHAILKHVSHCLQSLETLQAPSCCCLNWMSYKNVIVSTILIIP